MENDFIFTVEMADAIRLLRDNGCAVVIFLPEELGEADRDRVEDRLLHQQNAPAARLQVRGQVFAQVANERRRVGNARNLAEERLHAPETSRATIASRQ